MRIKLIQLRLRELLPTARYSARLSVVTEEPRYPGRPSARRQTSSPASGGRAGQCSASWEGEIAAEGSEERKMVMARRGDGRRRCGGVLEMVVMIRDRRNEEDGWLAGCSVQSEQRGRERERGKEYGVMDERAERESRSRGQYAIS